MVYVLGCHPCCCPRPPHGQGCTLPCARVIQPQRLRSLGRPRVGVVRVVTLHMAAQISDHRIVWRSEVDKSRRAVVQIVLTFRPSGSYLHLVKVNREVAR